MHLLHAAEFQRVRPPFAAATTTRSFPYAVLDGNHVRTVQVDEPSLPLAARGLRPSWSCMALNQASQALAGAVEFGSPAEVPVMYLRRPTG